MNFAQMGRVFFVLFRDTNMDSTLRRNISLMMMMSWVLLQCCAVSVNELCLVLRQVAWAE
jgi:hypothetical protein